MTRCICPEQKTYRICNWCFFIFYDLLVKIFSGYIVSENTILQELERHRKAHVEKLSIYKDLEQKYFQNPPQLPRVAKFQYLTISRGIRYETQWLEWCDEAMELLNQ